MWNWKYISIVLSIKYSKIHVHQIAKHVKEIQDPFFLHEKVLIEHADVITHEPVILPLTKHGGKTGRPLESS